jgi:hypothetical protein
VPSQPAATTPETVTPPASTANGSTPAS